MVAPAHLGAGGEGPPRPGPDARPGAARREQFGPIVPDVVDRPVGGEGTQQCRHVTVRFASQSDQSAASWGQAAFCPWRDANTSVSGPGRS